MTDTATIRLDLAIPAGSPVCGICLYERNQRCLFHGDLKWERADAWSGEITVKRHPACLAAEERFSPDPPTEPGWYKARLRRTGKWRIVEVTMVFGELRAYSVVGKYGRPLTHFDSWSTRLTMPGGE